MNTINNQVNYVYSSNLHQELKVKIGTLEGERLKPEYGKLLEDPRLKFSGLFQKGCADLMVKVRLVSDDYQLGPAITTKYKPFTNRWNWNEWIKLPANFSDLSRDAYLTFTIYDCAGPGQVIIVGGTSMTLFGKYGKYRQGMFDLRVWPSVEGSIHTPGKAPDKEGEQMQRLAKLVKKHRNGEIPKEDSLDRVTFRHIETINDREKKNSDYMYLMVEFQEVLDKNNSPLTIVYYEESGDEVHQFRARNDMAGVPDIEATLENLVESKHHRLARSQRSAAPPQAKPTAPERDRLAALEAAAPAQPLSADEQDLLWKYRHYLASRRRALIKFLDCVNWNKPGEVHQAMEMMKQWTPMDVEDALELLTPNFKHPFVRKYAISRLQQAPDEDLLLYLLQLVQALKYESFKEIHYEYAKISNGKDVGACSDADGKLSQNTQRGSQSSLLSAGPLDLAIIVRSLDLNDASVSHEDSGEIVDVVNNDLTDSGVPKEPGDNLSLASFLIERACKNPALANYFYWYLLIECEDQDVAGQQDTAIRSMYLTVMKTFSQTLAKGNSEYQKTRSFLARQQTFIDKLVKLIKTVARESGNRTKKAERLQQLLADPDAFKFNFTNFEPMPFPLDPSVNIKGIVAKKASLFKSALMPSKLTFLTTEGVEYEAIFKHGDDLRQDQLILQMITLMDKLLRRENLDLKLTPYKVLATSSKHGFLQFVESVTVAEALATEGSIQNFFRKYNPCENGPYGMKQETMDTYIRSCAGYCVITYLLGVGDRHLDNLLLTQAGALFHIDFGYILGRDPKPLPPPMKLSKEMVEAMGGMHSDHYQEFRKLCYTSFLHLRRHANLVLNLFSLMVDASVPDIALEPDKAVKKVQDKLRLDLGDEEAVQYFQNLLDMSVTAVMAVLVEQLHKVAQYWRK